MRRFAAFTALSLTLSWSSGCVSVVIESNDLGEDTTESSDTDTDTDTGDGDGDGDTGDGDGDTGEPIDPNKFRIVVLSDCHLPGPDYAGGDDSILLARDRLIMARDKIAAMSPPPDFVVVLGDMVHEAYPVNDPVWYQTNDSAFSDIQGLFASFPVPVYPVFGDSDYNVPDTTKQFSHALFAQFFASDPHSSLDHRGWRFVFANSQEGQTFDVNTVNYNPSVGSFGDVQMSWLSDQLATDMPTVVFSHFPLFSVALGESDQSPYPDLLALLTAENDNVALALSGHTHEWANIPATYPVPHIVFGGMRYDSDNFLLIEFTDSALAYDILDLGKVKWGTSAADTWVYSGTPKPSG